MRIVCFSDTHGYHEKVEIPDGDILIHAGDFSRRGSTSEQEAFDVYLGGLPHTHKIVIAGNHDWSLEDVDDPESRFHNAAYLQDSSITIDGVKFYGAPWQPEFYNWAFNLPRGEPLREKWSQIPNDTDVLITHGPPHGVLDRVSRGERVGCEDLLEAVQRVQPQLHVFGHIHEDYGQVERGGTVFVNPSTCNAVYRPVNPCVVVDI
ncbi:MAG: metallophosphoesterase [Gammaproteobacteria bacterium]|jgi:Icc-related predicted phosphoesterase|nr:metallophosphoesterase [Gammaproteobacteria bacterium]MBT4608271.1 metallophosphoesterase [Thiotrichales bacterium]MBT5464804.1 metallophosphoesterase [Candidatus Neomarinimicrobiota bacterium]MBT4811026.1 metallophosphoesterase [Thiotrichales bacterium]MBT5372402.1 metallophosphoesterase [Gammaproteobacteria bacterium]